VSVTEPSDAVNAELARQKEGRRFRASLHPQLFSW